MCFIFYDNLFYIKKLTEKLFSACDEAWTPLRGKSPGSGSYTEEVSCPVDGIFTKIDYTYIEDSAWWETKRMTSIRFTCDSAYGITSSNIFGTIQGTDVERKCPNDDEHIDYFTGVANEYLNSVDVHCVKTNQKPKNERIENRTASTRQFPFPFEDFCYATKGRRPVVIKISVNKDGYVESWAVKYVDLPVKKGCIVSHLEILDNIHLKDPSFEVLGFTSGSTCSSLEQQISLDVTDSVSHTKGSEKSRIDDILENLIIGIDASIGTKLLHETLMKLSFELSIQSKQGWTKTNSSSNTIQKDCAMGTTVNYKGPAIVLLVGLRAVYEIKEAVVKAKHHFTCEEGGSRTPLDAFFILSSKIFGNVFFLDYQEAFNSTGEECLKASYPQECVSSIRIRNFISRPDLLEKEFYKCLHAKGEERIPLEK